MAKKDDDMVVFDVQAEIEIAKNAAEQEMDELEALSTEIKAIIKERTAGKFSVVTVAGVLDVLKLNLLNEAMGY